MKFARVMGWCNTHLLLAIFFVILGIPAFFIRLSKSAIFHHLPDDRLSYWQEKENPPHTIDRAKHQF